ncbi:MAG: hypothetical protein AAF892_02970 [Cyanobacteria bacterium P01_D01_bin.71]
MLCFESSLAERTPGCCLEKPILFCFSQPMNVSCKSAITPIALHPKSAASHDKWTSFPKSSALCHYFDANIAARIFLKLNIKLGRRIASSSEDNRGDSKGSVKEGGELHR